jgi:hypothetical protein
VALSPFGLCESSGRDTPPRCKTVLIFKADRGSVKLPFREVHAARTEWVTAQKLDAFNAHAIRSLANQ